MGSLGWAERKENGEEALGGSLGFGWQVWVGPSVGVPIKPYLYTLWNWGKKPLCSRPLWVVSLAVPNYCYQFTLHFSPQSFRENQVCPGLSERAAVKRLTTASTRAAFFAEKPSQYGKAQRLSKKKDFKNLTSTFQGLVEPFPIIGVILENTFS